MLQKIGDRAPAATAWIAIVAGSVIGAGINDTVGDLIRSTRQIVPSAMGDYGDFPSATNNQLMPRNA